MGTTVGVSLCSSVVSLCYPVVSLCYLLLTKGSLLRFSLLNVHQVLREGHVHHQCELPLLEVDSDYSGISQHVSTKFLLSDHSTVEFMML